MEGQKIELDKDKSLKITKETHFGTTKGDLRLYNEDLTMREFDDYPRITITAAEDLDKFQKGIIKIEIQLTPEIPAKEFLIQIDGLLSIVYNVYAKTLNDLRTPSFRQKTVRIWGIIRKIMAYLRSD